MSQSYSYVNNDDIIDINSSLDFDNKNKSIATDLEKIESLTKGVHSLYYA
jgi:hypothetical protein